MTKDELIADVREALGVSEDKIPRITKGVDETILYFLRNWNFPRAGEIVKYTTLNQGVKEVRLRSASKRIMLVQIQDRSSPDDVLYKNLERSAGFAFPQPHGYPAKFWWQVGDVIEFDTAMPVQGLDVWVYRQHLDPNVALDFVLEEIADAVLVRTVYYLAPIFRKTEAFEAFSPLWMEQLKSLAIYTNELEFDGVFMQMGAPGSRTPEAQVQTFRGRYPK